MEARRRCRIMGVVDKVVVEDSDGRSRWRRCRTTGMDTAAEEMWEGNRRDVGRRRCINVLEGRRRIGQILIVNDYQPYGLSSLQ